jgi:hypothetical protein
VSSTVVTGLIISIHSWDGLQEFGRDDLVARQEILSETASVLKMLAETYSVPVVVTNQVRRGVPMTLCLPCLTRLSSHHADFGEAPRRHRPCYETGGLCGRRGCGL